ncbi:MAG: hypothetical protein JWR38_660 [Mucilaginibacter sp.]|nr:hypothetical protein [Mucilaginibacter sp.]
MSLFNINHVLNYYTSGKLKGIISKYLQENKGLCRPSGGSKDYL